MATLRKEEKVFFVSSPDFPFFPGTGGTEAFTFGHIQELRKRGIDARIVTIGQKVPDGRTQIPDIPFLDLANEDELSTLDATLIGVVNPFIVPTKKPAYIMAHVPPQSTAYGLERYKKAMQSGHKIITNSKYSQKLWAKSLGINPKEIRIVYPFAHQAFGEVNRPAQSDKTTRVLFAGRLHIDKGIYLLLEALHHKILRKDYRFTITNAYGHDKDGEIIAGMLEKNPWITLVEARHTPQDMAILMANHDIVVVPSNHHFWQEAFGMVSVEAQHAGCRVVASNAGGLPETDLGTLHLFEPGDSLDLANTIEQARLAGPVKTLTRKQAVQKFTVEQSVDSLLTLIGYKTKSPPPK